MNLFTETNTDKIVDHINNNCDSNLPIVLWVDLFCGFGGITEGYSRVKNNFIVACVNHDPFAIKNHSENHPHCVHYVEDVRDWLVVWKIQSLIDQLRKKFPEAIIGLHASLECTFFSKAKGGESREEDSRTLGYHLEKYLCFNPDYITIENVQEFLKWGPLYHVYRNKNNIVEWKYKRGREIIWSINSNEKDLKPFMLPIKQRESEDYELWKQIFKSKGYSYDYKILNAADFGEYTSRKRYYGCFAKNDFPITFPEPTHVSKEKHHLYLHLKLHNAVREKLELEDLGVSIFGLNKLGKYYESKTITRVHGGVEKFEGEEYFTSCYYGASQNGNGVHSIDNPLNTITTKDRFALHHIQYAYGKPTYSNLSETLQTITTVPKAELITTTWLFDTQFRNVGSSINKPSPTIIARQDKKPLYIANATNGGVDHSIPKEGDCEARLKLKKFMREKGITDIKIRSLYDYELSRIQGFPEDYILDKSITRSKKFIGNSVCPGQAKANAEALYNGIIKYRQNRKAS